MQSKADQLRGKLQEFVDAVVRHLPGEWAVPKSDDYRIKAVRDLDDVGLCFGLDHHQYVVVRPDVPKGIDGQTMFLRDWGVAPGDDELKAKVALDRNPAHAAKDIVRKVITPYEPMLAQIKATTAQRMKERAAARATFDEILAALGLSYHPRMEHPENKWIKWIAHPSNLTGRFQVSATGRVEIQLVVDPEVGIELARVARKWGVPRVSKDT